MPALRCLQRIAVIAALVVAAVAAVTPTASAQPAGSDPKVQARALVEEGLAAHARGDYDAAIALYERANELAPHPALFFNIAQAHRLAGRPEPALAMYRRYLDAVPTGALADQTRRWIATLEAAAPAGAAEPAPTATPLSAAVRPATRELATSGLDAGVRRQAEVAPRSRGRGLRIGGIASFGVGVAGMVAGGAYAVKALELEREVERQFDSGKYAQGQAAKRNARIGLGVGGALVATGVTLYILGARAGDDEPPVTALIGPGLVGAAVSGTF